MSNNNRNYMKVSFKKGNDKRRYESDSDSDSGHYNRIHKKNRNGAYKSVQKIQISSSNENEDRVDQGVIRFDQKKGKSLDEKDITPWMSNGTKTIKDSLLRLHNEIIEFYNYIKPSKSIHSSKQKKFDFIRQKILQIFPKATVQAFGSFATQLYLPDGDIDVAVLTNGQYQVSEVYYRINKFIQSKTNASIFTNIEYIRKSKVPLIKFDYLKTHFDISVDKNDGIEQIKYVQKINSLFPEFKYLTMVMKCTLRIRGLSETYTGGIGSFLLSCLILVYLKITIQKSHYYNLGEHLLQFMKFYSLNEDYWRQKTIYVKDCMIVDRNFDDSYFSCYSPQDETHDIGKSAFKIKDCFGVLKNRYRYIMDKNFRENESVLRVLVNPCEQMFRYYKEKN